MDGEHSYEISLKKDGLFINLSSDDVYFISKQMDKWFRILLDDSYVPVNLAPKPQPVPETLPQPQATEAALPAQPQFQPEVLTQPAPVEPAPPQPLPAAAEVPVQPPVELPQAPITPPVIEPEPQPLAEVQPVAAAAPVDLPPVMQPVAPAPPLETPQPVLSVPVPPAPALPQPVPVVASVGAAPKDDFEAVMDTVMRDLEPAANARPMPQPLASILPDEAALPAQPAASIDLSLISSLSDLCEQAHAGTSEDYLLLASYFLNQMERQESFSLKRINSNLVKSGLTPVNHSVLEAVLTKGYLSMVPDLTGAAEVSEYSLTADGLTAINRLF